LVHWHLRITLESSSKEQIQQSAERDRRSAASYVGLLIENALKQSEEKLANDPRRDR